MLTFYGPLQVTSKNPFDHPSILFFHMSTEQDWQGTDAVESPAKLCSNALDPYRGEEISRKRCGGSDAELDEFVRNHAEAAYHPSCSCKMGEDDMAVVDGQGRVHSPAKFTCGGCINYAAD